MAIAKKSTAFSSDLTLARIEVSMDKILLIKSLMNTFSSVLFLAIVCILL